METILFMIIVGILSTIFGKAKNGQTKSFKKTAEKFKEFQTTLNQQMQQMSKPLQPTKAKIKSDSWQEDKQELEGQYQRVRQESEESRQAMVVARHQAEKKSHVQTDESQTIISPEPDAKTILNGIIWAEVLGEPRSKRPYLARRR